MNLLFTRSQFRSSFVSIIPFRIGGTVTFRLKAELELTNLELALAKRYSFTHATLIASDTYEDLGRAYRPALFLGIIAAIGSAFLLPSIGRGPEALIMKVTAVPAIGLVTLLVLTFLYFFALRKHVTVSQLLNGGRTFYCHSVVELDEHEAELRDICKRFHATLEKARNWGGREINPIPDGEPYYLPDAAVEEHTPVIEKQPFDIVRSIKNLFTLMLPPAASEILSRARKQTGKRAHSQTPSQPNPPSQIVQPPAAAPPPQFVQPTPAPRTTPPPQTPPQSPVPPTSSPALRPSTPQTHTPAPPAQQTNTPPTPGPSSPAPPLHPLAPKPPKDDPSGF